MSAERDQLLAAIAAIEAQRTTLGDAVVASAVAALEAKVAAIGPPPEPPRWLRQATILFLDVVGSTDLSQHLDPEQHFEVMNGALHRFTAIVERHRGRVLNYAGDSVLAAFGGDATSEDDAEHAVLCGLALLQEGSGIGREVERAFGRAGFDVRVGIHTGPVLLGSGVGSDTSIHGMAVHVAARMEQTAPAGALRISHDTHGLVRGMFEVDAQPPLAVKGVAEPLQSYLVLRAKPRKFRIRTRGIEGVATRMIGRDAELEALQAAFTRLFADRRFAAVTVVADAGIGKSRLMHEFAAWAEGRPEGFLLFRGRATPQTGSQTFGLLRDIVAWRLEINDDDSVHAARRKMEEGVLPLFLNDGADVAEAHTHLLGHLIGIDWSDSRHVRGIVNDPRQIRNRAFHAAALWFRRMCERERGPALLQLEDLHWADGESLDFLGHLADVDRDVPVLLVGSTRPTFFERHAQWLAAGGAHERIDLAPLGNDASRDLLGELLKALPEMPPTVVPMLTASAQGNPLYMEELVRMLIDRGAIRTGESWTLDAERLLATRVPPTLTDVLQARLDGLPTEEKQALQQASVVGAVFWDEALAAVEARAVERLPALVRRELAVLAPSAPLAGLRQYAFHHQVLHQVTYDTVLKHARREGHARVARWLALLIERHDLLVGDFVGLAAEHFDRAGDAANAAEFHARAAEQAVQRFAHERVLAHADRALRWLADAGLPPRGAAELRWRLFRAREHALDLQGRRGDQEADLVAMERAADELADDGRRAHAAVRRSVWGMRRADWATMQEAARIGIACAERAGDDERRLLALRLLAASQVHQGHVEAGRDLALQGLAEARELGIREAEAAMLNVLGIAAEAKDDLAGSLEYNQQAIPIWREIGHRINESISLLNLGGSQLILGDLARAEVTLEAALQSVRANGDRVMEGPILASFSPIALWNGDAVRAAEFARAACEIAATAQMRDREALALLRLGNAELAAGATAAARATFTQARTRAVEIDYGAQHDATAGLARAALAEGDLARAHLELRPFLDEWEAGNSLDATQAPSLIELTCYQVLVGLRDPRALRWLSRVHGRLMAQADAIADARLRECFLRNIPYHREITAAWATHAETGNSGETRSGDEEREPAFGGRGEMPRSG